MKTGCLKIGLVVVANLENAGTPIDEVK